MPLAPGYLMLAAKARADGFDVSGRMSECRASRHAARRCRRHVSASSANTPRDGQAFPELQAAAADMRHMSRASMSLTGRAPSDFHSENATRLDTST